MPFSDGAPPGIATTRSRKAAAPDFRRWRGMPNFRACKHMACPLGGFGMILRHHGNSGETFMVIGFSILVPLERPAGAICDEFLDPSTWNSFRGNLVVPGITRATRQEPLDGAGIGMVFDVWNTDGTTHREEVIDYEHGRCIAMRMTAFPAPLRFLVREIGEEWQFSAAAVTRSFRLTPSGPLAILPLLLIRPFLRSAVLAHTRRLAGRKR